MELIKTHILTESMITERFVFNKKRPYHIVVEDNYDNTLKGKRKRFVFSLTHLVLWCWLFFITVICGSLTCLPIGYGMDAIVDLRIMIQINK